MKIREAGVCVCVCVCFHLLLRVEALLATAGAHLPFMAEVWLTDGELLSDCINHGSLRKSSQLFFSFCVSFFLVGTVL